MLFVSLVATRLSRRLLPNIQKTGCDAAKRAAFDAWSSRKPVPDAVKTFKAGKAWRFWRLSDPAVHEAVYQLANKAYGRGDEACRLQLRLARHHPHAGDSGAGRGIRRRLTLAH